MSVFRVPGNDVDDAVHCIRAPDRAAGTANYFDSINILKQCVLDLPIDAGKKAENKHCARR